MKYFRQKIHFAMEKVPAAAQCKQRGQTLTLQTHFLLLPNHARFGIKRVLSCWGGRSGGPQPDPDELSMELSSKTLLLCLVLVLTDAAPA